MVTGMLHLHSVLRWIILLLLLVSLFQAFTKKQALKQTSLWLLIAAHTIFVIGLYQLVAGRYGITKGLPEGVELMKNKFYRFYWIEHPLMMFIAISLITVARNKVKKANILFADKLSNNLWNGLEIEQYIRYLQIQYHLTKGVQNTFLVMAAHEDTRAYKKLRPFLVNFGYEEEMHYKLAEKDLKELGSETGEMPFVVELWWAYQKAILPIKPMERLGATAILENIGNYAAPIIKELFAEADFIFMVREHLSKGRHIEVPIV